MQGALTVIGLLAGVMAWYQESGVGWLVLDPGLDSGSGEAPVSMGSAPCGADSRRRGGIRSVRRHVDVVVDRRCSK